MKNMNIEWGKLGLLTTTLVGCFGALITKTVEPEVVTPIITLIIGYVTGNGRLASRGEMSVPLMAPDHDAQVDRLAGKLKDKLLGRDT